MKNKTNIDNKDKIIKKEFQEIPTTGAYHKIDSHGNQFWYVNGLLHRDNNQPAIVYKSGTKMWYQNGKLHSLNNPAIIYADGSQYWYKNGLLHRDDDKPTVILADGTSKWYINGKLYKSETKTKTDIIENIENIENITDGELLLKYVMDNTQDIQLNDGFYPQSITYFKFSNDDFKALCKLTKTYIFTKSSLISLNNKTIYSTRKLCFNDFKSLLDFMLKNKNILVHGLHFIHTKKFVLSIFYNNITNKVCELSLYERIKLYIYKTKIKLINNNG